LISIAYKPKELREMAEEKPSKPVFEITKNLVSFQHSEDDVNDFKIQPLLPNMFSYNGPRFASADIDKDGLADVFVCGAKLQAGALMLQQKNGSFKASDEKVFTADALYEDVAAKFFDADGDGDQDLYVVSGGFPDSSNADQLQDRLYINERGHFEKRPLPLEQQSGSCVVPIDFDNDGDLDLFVGSRVVPGRYPETPENLLLQNDGKGQFQNVINTIAPELKSIGMVTDAVTIDIDKDGKPELVICGEWMGIEVFHINNGKLQRVQTESASWKGWWNRLLAVDLDKDGDLDIVAGNWGTNSQIKGTVEQPVTMYYGDFDGNGYVDPLLCYYIGGKSYPVASRDELTDQIVSMRQRFPTYDSYAQTTIEDILSPEQLASATVLTATHFATTWFENVDGKLLPHELPAEAEFSPVCAIASDDFNGDGNPDIFLAGNIDQVRIKIGRMDANYGTLLAGDGKGHFSYVPQRKSGLQIKGCVKDALILPVNGQKHMLLGINNQATITLKYK
jgi:hypothetical protein